MAYFSKYCSDTQLEKQRKPLNVRDKESKFLLFLCDMADQCDPRLIISRDLSVRATEDSTRLRRRGHCGRTSKWDCPSHWNPTTKCPKATGFLKRKHWMDLWPIMGNSITELRRSKRQPNHSYLSSAKKGNAHKFASDPLYLSWWDATRNSTSWYAFISYTTW